MLVGAFNQEKALVGAFSVIVKTDCATDGALYTIQHHSLTLSLFQGRASLRWWQWCLCAVINIEVRVLTQQSHLLSIFDHQNCLRHFAEPRKINHPNKGKHMIRKWTKKHGWVPYFIIIHTWVYVIFFTLHYMDMVGNKNWWRTLFFLLCWQRQGINTRPHTINITYEEFCPSDVSRNSVHYIPSIFDEPWSYERV